MISSKAVYVDDEARHSNSDSAPIFAEPISEAQPTVAPGDMDYNSREGYGANKVAAEQVLLDSGSPVTVLRPSKIHGAGTARPREWIFVKRVLDGRTAVFLANLGAAVDHPSAAVNIAALIEAVAARPGARILNSADPDAPSALEISRTIARHLDHEWEEILLPDGADERLGVTPWNTTHPIVLDMSAAAELGYEPVGDYAMTVVAEVDWLVTAAHGGPEAWLLPALGDAFFDALLDYAAEDAYLARRRSADGAQPLPRPLDLRRVGTRHAPTRDTHPLARTHVRPARLAVAVDERVDAPQRQALERAAEVKLPAHRRKLPHHGLARPHARSRRPLPGEQSDRRNDDPAVTTRRFTSGKVPSPMRLLVTGGAGFIGSHFVRGSPRARRRGRRPRQADVRRQPRRTSRASSTVPSRATSPTRRRVAAARRRLRRDRQLRRRDARRPLDPRRRREFIETDVLGTQVLLDARASTGAAASCRSRPTRCTATSSDARLVHARTTRFCRRARTRPRRPAATCWCSRTCARYGVDASITRGANTYGPTSIPRSRSRCSSPTRSTTSRCRSTATAAGARLAVRRRPLRRRSSRARARAPGRGLQRRRHEERENIEVVRRDPRAPGADRR